MEFAVHPGMVRILLLEDDPHYREIIERILLRNAPYAVESVATEKQAQEALAGNEYDLVLLDLNIDGRRCWETLARVVRHPGTPPAIVISCEDTRENADYAVSRGAYAFLPKPFSFTRLQMAIESALQARNREAPEEPLPPVRPS
jgi:DNA-binding NtrC family response regulator